MRKYSRYILRFSDIDDIKRLLNTASIRRIGDVNSDRVLVISSNGLALSIDDLNKHLSYSKG